MSRCVSVLHLSGLSLALAVCLLAPTFLSGQVVTPTFVQQSSAVPQSTSVASVSATFAGTQTAGNLNVVVIGWNDTSASVTSVSDTLGNVYARAVGPTQGTGLTQSIYYAKNIVEANAGANRVTVAFSPASQYPDLRILEYRGIDPINAFDMAAAGASNSTTSNSGAVTTTNANDLLVGGNTVATLTSAAGTGFTNRVITNPNGDIAEDRVVTATGSYNATASISGAGPWVMQMVAFRAAVVGPPDTTPPTAPTNLAVTAVSSSQINLSWTASTDNIGVTGYRVERCQGTGCTNFAQVGTSAGMTYNDTGLASATSYSYRVRATDAVGNSSAYSSTATATTLSTSSGLVAAYSFDEGAGTAVTDSSGTGNTGTILNATWTSTGKYGKALAFNGTNSWVTIPDVPSLDLTTSETLEAWVYPFTIPPLGCSPASTCSWMDVIHKDSDRYYIEASSSQNQEPEAGGVFTSGKHIVFGPSVLPINAWTHLALTYDSAFIRFYVNGTLVASSPETSPITTSTNPLFIGGDQTQGQFFNGLIDEVRIYNTALSQVQIQADMNTPVGNPAPDTQPPTAPSSLTATAVSASQINLGWTASTDNVGVAQYLVERCPGAGCTNFAQIATPTVTSFSDTGVTAATVYSYRVRATDAAGNLSPYSGTASAATQAGDTIPPSAPANLSATAASSSQVNLSWTASTDNVGLTGYRVERCQGSGCTNFAQIATPSGTSYGDTGLAAATSYSYRVLATDAAGNLSPYSNTATSTTQAPDVTPPTVPSSLVANAATSSQIGLSWTASTDAIGVTGYRVERCQGASCATFVQVATPTTTTFNDSGLTASTPYSYRVRATDAAGNLSGYSNVTSATTAAAPTGSPAFVQVNSAVPQSSSVSSVPVTYAGTQTAGNVNVVIVGWNNTTGVVTSVGDTSGNAYVRVVGPTLGAGLSQSIYVAKNIAGASAGVNRVTVAFSPTAAYPDVRVLEYSGIDLTNPVDATAAGAGSNATSSSGIAVTSNATDLLVSGNTVSTLTSAPGTGFTSRVITTPNGDIAEDRLVSATGSYSGSASLSSAGAWVMQMVALRAAGSPPPPPDTIPPTVSITSPAQGATVSGFVTVTANATDNNSVAGVQFKADGSNIGAEVTSFPYTVIWDTSALVPGSHILTATARDAAGNTATSAAVTVTVQSAATLGQWLAPVSMPLVAVHVSLMPNGKLLIIDGQSFGLFPQVWDLSSNTFSPVNAPINLFCSGHTLLADGRVIVLGGHDGAAHVGLTGTNIFNPQTQGWSVATPMADRRWYPTATPLPDGRVIVFSGETNCDGCFVARPDIYNPASNNWTQLTNAGLSFPYYPHSFVLPDGRVLVSSTAEAPIISRVLNLNTQAWTAIGSTALDGGSAVMYRPGKILKAGTSTNADLAVRPSSANSYVLDMNQTSPAWRQVSSMAFARTYATMVMLPDGTVFTEGGGTTTEAVNPTNAVYAAEIWNPTTETWTTVGSAATPRLYHNTALLMPDGRVWVSGGGRFVDGTVATDRFNAEFYLPPYFFKGARPTITSTPATLQYSQSFTVQTPNAAQIGSVVLLRIGSVTHAFNMSQYYVPLTFAASSGSLNVQTPANPNLAPPGYYMLFILNTNGVPSVASIVNLPVTTGSTQPPTAPTNLVGSGGAGSVNLSWSASTGPNGVAGYSVYRGTAPGVVLSVPNRIAQPTATTYVDSSFPSSGNYYYVVTARDPSGTESGPSNEVVVTVSSDVAPPTDPSALSATAVSNSQINLAWTGSTDNIGVTNYLVERCQSAGCSSFALIATPSSVTFGDTGLTASTSYSYRVRARDAAGNVSGYTNTATATTSSIPTPPSTPTFKQQNNAVPQSTSVASIAATFTAAQDVGNLNVVIVGWNDTAASVTTVTDTAGNVYTRAVGPTLGSGLSQSIYYAKNIVAAAAGANRVTVAFSPAAKYPDLRILEYSGIDPVIPVDATTAAVGNSSSSSSGTAITTNPTDLLVGANTVATLTSGPGSGFSSRIITNPNGDIAEDQNVATTGTYSATAPLNSSGPWAMQMVAFRAAGSSAPAIRAVESGPPVE